MTARKNPQREEDPQGPYNPHYIGQPITAPEGEGPKFQTQAEFEAAEAERIAAEAATAKATFPSKKQAKVMDEGQPSFTIYAVDREARGVKGVPFVRGTGRTTGEGSVPEYFFKAPDYIIVDDQTGMVVGGRAGEKL